MTLLSILADFNVSVVWMVLILILVSSSSSLLSKPLGTVPTALLLLLLLVVVVVVLLLFPHRITRFYLNTLGLHAIFKHDAIIISSIPPFGCYFFSFFFIIALQAVYSVYYYNHFIIILVPCHNWVDTLIDHESAKSETTSDETWTYNLYLKSPTNFIAKQMLSATSCSSSI